MREIHCDCIECEYFYWGTCQLEEIHVDDKRMCKNWKLEGKE